MYEIKKYANIISYPLVALVITQFINYIVGLGNVVTLIEIFTYAFIGFIATKNLNLKYTDTVIIASSVAIIYYIFVESFHFYQGIGFSLSSIVYQFVVAIVTSFVISFITRKYMVNK